MNSQPAIPTWQRREALLLASYAFASAQSKGRVHTESEHAYRGPYQRDRDRILHSAAFRRLSDKTQVFTGEWGDHHRTRLTHTLEVAGIARTISRELALNEDLVEALALMHDLGHPPFGHAGEDVLNECLIHAGGFSHNQQGLRIVEYLEQRYPGFPGLNLSWEVLEGQRSRANKARQGPSPLLEVQVVDAADSLAYGTHDADDALNLGFLSLPQLLEVECWAIANKRVLDRYPGICGREQTRAIVKELVDWQVADVLESTRQRLAEKNIQSLADVQASVPIVLPSQEMQALLAAYRAFMLENVYRNPHVMERRQAGQELLRSMFHRLVEAPLQLPQTYQIRASSFGLPRSVADYLAGMTDRFAQQFHKNWPTAAS